MKEIKIRNVELDEFLQLMMLWNKDTFIMIYKDSKPAGYIFITKEHLFYAYFDGSYGSIALDKILEQQDELSIEVYPDRIYDDKEESKAENLMDYFLNRLGELDAVH